MAHIPPQPVDLPAQPRDPRVPLPFQPQYPPTVAEVCKAVQYRQHVESNERLPPEQCTVTDLYNSVIYEHNVIAQAAGAQGPEAGPAWFQGAMTNLHARINQVQTDLHALRNQVQTDLRIELRGLKRLLNRQKGGGALSNFEVVPFLDGSDPTGDPHNLPQLRSIVDILNLNNDDLAAYLAGYGVPAPDAPADVQRGILKVIIGF